MKFLRALLLFFFLSCVREGLAQITCDFTFQNSAAVKCTPYFLLATANNVSSSAVIERCWYLTGPQPFTVCNNQLNSTFSTVITTEGIYSLRLWTRNANGDTCFIEKTIEIAPKPVTNFTFAPLEGCAPLCVQAVCNSQAGVGRVIDSVVVDWGCGPITFLNACTPTPITRCFTCPPGIYSPTVVIKNDAGCYDDTTYLSLVRVLTPPVASFTGDTTYANCASGPLTVNFVADNAGPNMTYVWYIDAALVQSGPSRFLNNRVFAINNANCYDIKLVVTHPSGCGDSLVRNDYICVRSVPQVSFTQNATTGCVSAQSPFTLGLTSNTGSLSWSLSNTGGGTYPTQNGTVATYSLTLPGTYTVTATGTFGIGCSATTTQQVLVLSPKPVAAFTANDRFGCSPPDTVSYTATPCANCRYQWTLDGATPRLTSQQNPTVIYTGYGPWTSSLRVTDTITGCSDTLTRPGYINLRRISPVIGRNRVEGCSPVCVDFQDRTNYSTFPDSVSSICWSFSGNVPGACQSSLNRCFTDPGCYNVKLVVTSTTGCVDSTTINRAICVGTPPVCTFSANPTTMCFEEEPIVISTTCDSFDYFHVNWGDGDSGDVYTPVFEHFYQDTGNLTTCITPYRDSCAGVKYCFPVRVNPPIAGWTDSSTCFTGDTVFFVNKTAGATSYLWNFCDGTTSTLTNPFKVFPRCDTCTVTLAAYNSFTGCTHEKTARVNTACDGASLSPRTRSGCGPLTVNFFNTSASSTPNFTRWYFNCNNCTNFSGCPNSQGGNTTTFTFNTVGNHCVAMRNRTSSGCIDTVYSFIKVCKPIANFTSNNSCFPDPICFTYRGYDSLCAIIRRRWSFGDGTVDSVTLNPCHLYTTPGSYQVTLFIQNDAGCTSTITKTVIVSDTVRLNYLLDDTLCPGTTHCVTNSSIGANLTYQWTIPDAFPGDTFTDPAPCYTINTEGDYWIYVNISSNNVCTTTDSTLIHAHPPTASGYISDNFIECPNPPQIIQFISTSTYYDSLAWNFGDLVFSNLDTAAHIYSYPGVYPICITTTTYDGCSSTACIDTIVVEGPYGSLTVLESPGICACEDTVHFQVSTVNSNALTLLYGCAQGFVQDNSITPIGTQANPTVINFQYAYCLIDSCQPQMIFGDTTGCLVYVEAPFIYIDSPTVNFTFDSYASCLTGIVCFSDSTTYNLQPYQSYTIQRRWDFGDNSAPDTSANPCHTYPGAGTYNPRLYIWSNLGCFDSMVSQVVIIPEIPRAEFYADDSTVCAYTSVCFHSISTTDSLTAVEFRTWDFGDGTLDTSNRRNVCHTYTAGGLYRVTLCIRDSLGCPNCDSSFVIQIIDNPVADAGGDQTICYDVSTLLNGTGAAFCLWSPSGLVSDPAICNPTVQLTSNATLVLIVTDQYQCRDTDTVALTVARVNAGFNAGNTFCLNDSICVIDTSSNLNGILTSFNYNFGEGNPQSGANVCHKYTSPGSYSIEHIVIDDNGCTDTAILPVVIYPNPNADFTINDSVICSNEPVCVTDLSNGSTSISWGWNFGGPNANASGSNPACYTYNAPFQPDYIVQLVVTDLNNCTDTARRLVTVLEAPIADFDWDISCENVPMPLTNTSIAGDAVINSNQWTLWLGAPTPLIDNNTSTSFIFPIGFHDVQLIVTDLNGCVDTVVKTVRTDLSTNMAVNPGDTTICLGTAVDYTVTGLFNSVSWSPSVWVSDPNAASVIVTPQANVSYIVTALNGACAPAKDTITIQVIQPIPIELMASPEQIVLGLSSNITSQIPGRIDSIIWDPSSTLDCRDCRNPVATPTQTTTYTATIYYSLNGVTCTSIDSITIQFLNSCDEIPPYLPNTFTPNADGMNDVFMIRGVAGKKINYFRIFDRWGKLVFESSEGNFNDPRWGWDGNDNGGKKMNPAVFVYTYEIECVNGETKQGKGNVSLVR